MRNQSCFVAIFRRTVAFGLCATLGLCGYSQAGPNYPSQIAFSTSNLLVNGEFDQGTSAWVPSGSGLKWRVENQTAIFNLSPIPGAPASQLSFSQIVQKPVKWGQTLALRFQAKGRGRLGVVVYETMGEKRTLFARRLTVTKGNEFETFTLAVKTPASYYAGQLAIKFHLGYDQNVLGLSQVRLVDLGETKLSELSLTPDETKLPELLPTKTVEPVQSSALIATPKIEIIPIRPKVSEPLDSTTGLNLIKNGDFAEQDKHWRAWGDQRVNAQLEGKTLYLTVTPIAGESPWTAGFEQNIDRALRKGEKLTVRFKASGNTKFGVKTQEIAAPYAGFLWKEEVATETQKEYVYQCEVNRDYNANEAKLCFFLNYTAGDVAFSDIQMLISRD